ncbi:MAG: hypothetical protein HC866_17590 [Leptolyngbyaceae cyanobacterium RU_5_1]|nr:hypothetical protein [Leptolyngbyaceae cyanobacterium RU_5_1]
MQYSLLHRFQGCLVGMVLGERLGLYVEAQRFPPWRSLNQPPQLNPRSESLPDQSCADMHHWNPGVQSPAIASTQPTAWSTLALRYAEGLIQIGTWRIEDHHPPGCSGFTLNVDG